MDKRDKETSKKDYIEIPVGKYLGKIRDNPWMVSSIVLGVLLVAVLIMNIGVGEVNDIGERKIGENLVSFVKARTGEAAEVLSVNRDGPFYTVVISLQGQQVPVYMTTDGKYLIPSQPMLLSGNIPPAQDNARSNTISGSGSNTENSETQANVQKSDKPKVELFVMSHCPYGTQTEKGILPVVELLGDKINFEVKFVSYAMHGEKEVIEQLNQYCIQKEQNDKFLPYLSCFLEAGESEACLAEVGINTAKLKTCTTTADEEFDITKNLEDKSSWSGGRFPLFDVYKEDNQKYGVRGSPTLVINGQQVSSARDSASLLRTICAGFNTAPSECSSELSSASPSPGFGFQELAGSGGGGANAGGGCGV